MMHPNSKITLEQREELLQRYRGGEPVAEIAASFGLAPTYVAKLARSYGVKRPKTPGAKLTGSGINEFAKRARSILWRQDHSKEKPTYDKWNARVDELVKNAGLTQNQAIVRASKEYPCLHKLFREYDVSDFDPNPESHAEIKHYGHTPQLNAEVFCEGIEQSYRDSLRWALQAAGAYLRTKKNPVTCPCDAAWYLYRQAIEEPKEFLGRVGQVEAKSDPEEANRRSIQKSAKKSISEIDSYLEELDTENESDGDTQDEVCESFAEEAEEEEAEGNRDDECVRPMREAASADVRPVETLSHLRTDANG